MKKHHRISSLLGSIALILATSPALAQAPAAAEPRNIVQLSAMGTVEVQQDWLTVTLAANKEGNDAGAVQTQLRQALESALAELKKAALPDAMEVRSGNFNLQQRYNNDGKINGWSGSAELVVEGSDFARISTAAGKAQPMTIRNISFGLSRAARTRLETQAQALAIDNFKARATQIAHGFGFADFVIREVQVSSTDHGIEPMPRMVAMSARAMVADAAPMPMESGKSLVQVSVSGAVQLK
jgi:predicted secreted protein